MTNEVRIRVSAQDAASKEFNAISANAAKMGSTIKAGIAGAALAGIGFLTAGLKGSVSAAQESLRASAQLTNVLLSTGGAAGVTAKQAEDLASHYQKVTRIQDEVVLSAENMLLTFTNIKANIFPDTTKAVLDMATFMKHGGIPTMEDLRSAAIQIGKAMQDPITGMTALRRVGASFDEQQQEQIKTMVQSGNVLGAQKMILAELKKEFGGAAGAMTPFERVVDSISDVFHNAQEAVGTFIIGGLTLLSQWVETHGPQIRTVLSAIAPVFQVIRAQVEASLGGVIGVLKAFADIVVKAIEVVKNLAHGNWSQAWDDMKSIATDHLKALANAIVAIFGIIPNVIISGIEAAINGAISALNAANEPINKAINFANKANPFGDIPTMKPIKPVNFDSLRLNTAGSKDFEDAINKVGAAAKVATPPTDGMATAIDEIGAKGKTLGETLRGGLDGIRGAATALFSSPTKEMAALDLSLEELTQTNRRQRPAIEAAIEAYNQDADAHEAAATAIEESGARVSAAFDVIIGKMEAGLDALRDQFDQEREARDKALKSQSRADQDLQEAASDQADALRRRKDSVLDSLNAQKDAIPDGPDAQSQKDALDQQIKALSNSYDKQIQAQEDGAKSQARANEQRDRQQEDARDKAEKIQQQAEKDAQAAIDRKKKEQDQEDADHKKAADAERALAGKAKDEAEASKRRLEQFDKEEASLKLRLDLMNGEHEIMKKRIITLDQTLLSESQLRDRAGELGGKTFILTGAIDRIADKMNIDLTGAFDALKTAVDGLSTSMLGQFPVPHYANGTNYVPNDGLAYLHKGEKVVTASNNQSVQIFGNVYMGGSGNGGGSLDDLMLARLN